MTGNKWECDDGLCFHVRCARCNPSGAPAPYGGNYMLPTDPEGEKLYREDRAKSDHPLPELDFAKGQ